MPLTKTSQYPQPFSADTSSSLSDQLDTIAGMAPRSKVTAAAEAGPQKRATASSRASAYDADFMKHLAEMNIEAPRRTNLPANFEQLRERLRQPRASLTSSHFSDDEFEAFLDKVENARDENRVMSDVFPAIKGVHTYPSTQNRPCRNWKPLSDGKLVIPQPDFFDGVRKGSKYKQIREVLDTLIVPSAVHDCPFLPNFFGEAKGPKGSPDVAIRQACYDGFFGTRAMHHLRAYGRKETYDHKAYTFTFTYYSGFLEIYAHHMSEPDEMDTQPHYHMSRLGAWALQGSNERFVEGATAFRNLRDLAREIREEFLASADARMRGIPEELRRTLIEEATQRVRGSAPVSFEDAVRTSLSHSQIADDESPGILSSEAGNESDVTVTPEENANEQEGPKDKATSKVERKKGARSKDRVQKRPASIAKVRRKARANAKAGTHGSP